MIDLAEQLHQPIDRWRPGGAGRAAHEASDVVELVVDHRLLEHSRGSAGDALAGLAREVLGLAGEASESSPDFRRHRERGLALDRLHQGLQRRVRARQDPGDLDELGEIPIVDDGDVADELTPDASIVFEVEALDRLGEGRRRRRRTGAG